MTIKKLIVFGTGQIADIAHYYLVHDSNETIAGFTVDKAYLEHDTFQGLPVVPFEDIRTIYPPDDYRLFIPISYRNINIERQRHYETAKTWGYEFTSYVSSKAVVAKNVTIGENCFIMELNNVQPFVTIGNNCILWSSNHIGHHSMIGDHVFLASHVVVSGNVQIGDNTFIGVNATLRDNIKIGKHSVLGAGAIVLHNTEPYSVYPGKASKPSDSRSDELKGL